MRIPVVTGVLLGLLTCGLLAARAEPPETGEQPVCEDPQAGAHEGEAAHEGDADLPHAFAQVTERLYRSAQPMGEATFRALAARGIKVVVSVDGARPDVEAARKAGIRYVHIPTAYSGITREQELAIAKVVTTLEGPFLFHCHHGKHRGPAGCAIALRTLEGPDWDPDALMKFMEGAGTSHKYAGLYRDVARYVPPTAEELAAVPAEFPEYVAPQGFTKAMVDASDVFERLGDVKKAGWKSPAGHPDVDPPHEALILAEALREMGRLPDTASRPDEFKAWLKASEDVAWALSELLRADPVDATAAGEAFGKLSESCNVCHATYRNAAR